MYYSVLVLSDDHNNILFPEAVSEHSVFRLMFFVVFAIYDRSCNASGDLHGTEDICWGGILLLSSQVFLDSIRHVRFCESVRSCTFATLQIYLAFRRAVGVNWNSLFDVGRLS